MQINPLPAGGAVKIFWKQLVYQKYSDITAALGFDFEPCSAQFVMSQIQENNFVVQNEPFVVVLENDFFVDRFMPKHTHYTLTKIQKVKKHNRTPLRTIPSQYCTLVFLSYFQ